jgi:3-oxoacyl-[acyl-carrier protein] reductase
MAGKLDGKVAIVTGSGRGIGAAIARKLASEGAAIVINDLDEAPAAQTLQAIVQDGGRGVVVPGDVAAPDFGERMVADTLKALGRIDIVVNNAGYIWNTTIQNHSDEQWYAMIDVHATAPFRLLRALTPYLREATRRESQDGQTVTRKVVTISSASAVYGAATQLAYATAKAALFGMTRSLCKEWGRYNVTVNCIAFGYIDTRLTQRLEQGPATIEVKGRDFRVGLPPEYSKAVLEATPLGRFGRPEDAANGVYLFCIPESDFISGQTVVVGGGLQL